MASLTTSLSLSLSLSLSYQQKDELYLNLVLDYVPETVYRVIRHHSKAKQVMPQLYVKVSLCLIIKEKEREGFENQICV